MPHLPNASAKPCLRVAVLNWRDRTHPDGGGSERYVEQVAHGLVGLGHDVTLLCADHGRAPRDEVVRGLRVRRRGSRLSVYAHALAGLVAGGRKRPWDVVVDVQNGLPFCSPLVTRAPVVNLVHHVHREQWPVVFGRLTATVGWWVESKFAPRVYRGQQYVAVSEQTREELAELGVAASDVAVVHNGTDRPLATGTPRSADPVLVVLGRLVPHKRVEHAMDVLARLLPRHPRLTLRVVGEGWWHDELEAYAERLGVRDRVHLTGYVDEHAKHAELARAWVKLAPSVKEGWGLCVVEAGSHGVPTVAYQDAGGLSESVQDGRTGLLVSSLDEMVAATERLLVEHDLRAELGAQAHTYAERFTWESTVRSWETLLRHVAAGGAPTHGIEHLPPAAPMVDLRQPATWSRLSRRAS